MADLIERDALLLKQKVHADLFADSTFHDDIVRRDEATAALAEIINAPAVDRWIPVKDALPEQSGVYLAYFTFKDGTHATDIAYINTGCCLGSITHWMPLPEPPKEDET